MDQMIGFILTITVLCGICVLFSLGAFICAMVYLKNRTLDLDKRISDMISENKAAFSGALHMLPKDNFEDIEDKLEVIWDEMQGRMIVKKKEIRNE